jgi:low temperature requirement protein LtrA
VEETAPVTAAEEEKRTGFIELFFDLVFVFAFTQVTALVLEDTSAEGFARAALVFALVWWAWSAYAWLTDAIDVENVPTRLFIFGATLGVFFVALAVPNAFTDEAAWFAVAYFVIRVLHIALYLWGVRHDPVQLRAVALLAPWFLIAPTIALIGGFADDPARTALWCLSLAVDVVGTLFAARSGFQVAASHFAERFALIVIIALGESVVAIGLGAEGLAENWTYAIAVAVALAGAAVAWWAYFDFVQLAAERALGRAGAAARGPLARDVYTFFHYPIVLGIIFLAVAAKKTLAAADGAAGRGRTRRARPRGRPLPPRLRADQAARGPARGVGTDRRRARSARARAGLRRRGRGAPARAVGRGADPRPGRRGLPDARGARPVQGAGTVTGGQSLACGDGLDEGTVGVDVHR